MKKILLSLVLFVPALMLANVPKISPADAAKLVADGKAVLVDVREPSEWLESGVAAPAVLLPKSEFDDGLAGEWKDFLAKVGDKEIITYCRSGKRADVVAKALAGKRSSRRQCRRVQRLAGRRPAGEESGREVRWSPAGRL